MVDTAPFKIQSRKECRFDSDHPHHNDAASQVNRQLGLYCEGASLKPRLCYARLLGEKVQQRSHTGWQRATLTKIDGMNRFKVTRIIVFQN